MDHREIVEQEINEKYVLGQLSQQEEARFEEHYFGCDRCFADVREMETVIGLLRRANREATLEIGDLRATGWKRLLPAYWLLRPAPVPALALIGILVVLLYSAWNASVLVPRLQTQVRALTSPAPGASSYFLDLTREAVPVVKLSDPSTGDPARFLLSFALQEPRLPGSRYAVEIQDEAGAVLWRADSIEPDPSSGLFTIACVGSYFSPGRVRVAVFRAGASEEEWTEVAMYALRLRNEVAAGESGINERDSGDGLLPAGP